MVWRGLFGVAWCVMVVGSRSVVESGVECGREWSGVERIRVREGMRVWVSASVSVSVGGGVEEGVWVGERNEVGRGRVGE